MVSSSSDQGLRAIGASVALSTSASIFINGLLGPKTRTRKLPSPLCPIYVKNIHKGKHGGSSGVYDSEGRFVSEKFEDIFQKYAKIRPDALTSKELDELIKAKKDPKDHKGSFGNRIEWKVLYNLCKDRCISSQGVLDGTLFLTMEQERASSHKKS